MQMVVDRHCVAAAILNFSNLDAVRTYRMSHARSSF